MKMNTRYFKPQKRHKLIIFTILLLTFTLFTAFFTPPANAQTKKPKTLVQNLQNEITLGVFVGIENHFFPRALNPININIHNGTAANFEGEIIVNLSSSYYRIINVLVGPQTSKRYTVYAKFDEYCYSVNVSIINSSNIVIYNEKTGITQQSPQNYHILAIAENQAFINPLKKISVGPKPVQKKNSSYNKEPDASTIQIIGIKPDEMFENFACYEPFSLVILNGADVSTLTNNQQQALVNYVNNGGALMVSYGGFVSKLSGSKIAEILPVKITGSDVIDGSVFYKYAASGDSIGAESEKFQNIAIALSSCEALPNSHVISSHTSNDAKIYPLIVHHASGAGIVYFTAFDISQVYFDKIDYLKDNISGILKRSAENDAMQFSSLVQAFNRFCNKITSLATQIPSPHVLILCLIAYTFIMGPIFYYFIRKRVTMRNIIVFPLTISLAFYAAFKYSDFDPITGRAAATELTLQLIDNQLKYNRLISSVSILQPPMSQAKYVLDSNAATLFNDFKNYSRTESEIVIDEDSMQLITPQLDYRYSKYGLVRNANFDAKFSVEYSDALAATTETQYSSYADTDFQASSSGAGSRIANELQVYFTNAQNAGSAAKKLNSIVNNTDFSIKNCGVFYAGSYCSIDKFASGDRLDFSPQKISGPDTVLQLFNSIITENFKKTDDTQQFAYHSSYEQNEDFLKAAISYIIKISYKSPVLIGYVPSGGSGQPYAKTSGCIRNDLGSLVIVKL